MLSQLLVLTFVLTRGSFGLEFISRTSSRLRAPAICLQSSVTPFHTSILSPPIDLGNVQGLLPKLLAAGYGFSAVEKVSRGLDVWSQALLEGVCPDGDDDRVQQWPNDASLYNAICSTFTSLDLPRTVKRHPVLLGSVLKSLVELAIEMEKRMEELSEKKDEEEEKEEEGEEEEEEEDEEGRLSSRGPLSDEEKSHSLREEVSRNILAEFERKWRPPLNGIKILDDIYGPDHDLINGEDDDKSSSNQDGTGGGGGGFGLFDAVWKDAGFEAIKDLQERLTSMDELRDLINALGRRPSVTGDSMKRIPPQVFDSGAPLGVAKDPAARDDLSGIRKSNSLEFLLPSEAMLLINSPKQSRRPRLLFLAKFVESSLRSYQMDGWVEVNSRSKRKPWRHFEPRPTSTGGPIIVCLDTSYSMAGPREQLAKAVVLQVAQLSAKDNRPFYVLAFSGTGNLAECELKLGASKEGLLTLLRFLGKSFRGGTDVTTPLARAVQLLEDTVEWASSDILLVTDGELMNPPLPQELLDKIRFMEQQRGLEVHGLVVGNRFATPELEFITTKHDGVARSHNFLYKYDELLAQFCQPSGDEEDGKGEEQVVETKTNWMNARRRSRSLSSSRRKNRAPRSRSVSLSMTPSNSEQGENLLHGGREMVERVVGELSKGLVERDCEVRLLLLAALSREHIILLGPPGTGKSELARRLGRISGGLYFERLLTKFTSPEELFGPLSLASLERDEFVRSIGGYLPCASVAFLDEAFKSSSAILNSLLTILNERKFDNGASSVKVPLLTVVGASNELPDSEELDAFYDRFLIRKLVEPISDANVHLLFLPGPAQAQEENAGESLLVNEALADEIFLKSQSVDLPPQVVSLLVGIRAYLRDKVSPPVYVSDRRLKKAAGALRVAALCNGRRSVSITDCLLLEHILWFAPEEQEVVSNYLWDHIVPSADGEIASFGFLADAILRRLSDALLSDNESAFAAETMELEKLTGVVQQRLTEAKQLAKELSSTEPNNLFLTSATNLRAKQQAAPLAQDVADKYLDCLEALSSLCQEVKATNVNVEFGRQNAAETLSAVRDSQAWRRGFGGRGAGGRDPFDETMELMDKLDLNLSPKEAKRTLTKEQYREWKKLKAKQEAAADNYWT